MTALEIIGMILLLFLLLSLLRVGVIVDFGGELRVRLRVGPVKLTVLPRKEKKAQKKAAEAAGKTPEEKTKPKAAGGHRLPKLSFPELRELMIEASATARMKKQEVVSAPVLEEAYAARVYRANLVEEIYME